MKKTLVNPAELQMGARTVISPEAFDKLLETKNISLALIRAWTVMPLSRYMDDLNGFNTHNQQWIQRLPTEEKKSGFLFLGKKQEVFPTEQEVLSLFQQIRRYYGWQSGMSDLLRGTYPKIAEQLYQGDYSSVVHLGCIYSKYAPLDSWDKVYKMVEEGNTYPHSKPNHQTIQKGIDLLKRAVGRVSLVNKIYKEASLRQGVHVIYGGDSFLDFYRISQRNERLDSAVWNATRMETRIPLKFATAVLPLGIYEREKLI
ncbi:MAG: hypothetical protein BroJett025_00540 [Patescibacteria group bacterium]|nr:MAG: hypothetical protein BroJett025_00540 [Patescibacteria group bacterium]